MFWPKAAPEFVKAASWSFVKSRLVFPNYYFCPPVSLVGPLGFAPIHRVFFAPAHRVYTPCRDIPAGKVKGDRSGAPLAESQVVLPGAAFVGVAHYHYVDLWNSRKNSSQLVKVRTPAGCISDLSNSKKYPVPTRRLGRRGGYLLHDWHDIPDPPARKRRPAPPRRGRCLK